MGASNSCTADRKCGGSTHSCCDDGDGFIPPCCDTSSNVPASGMDPPTAAPEKYEPAGSNMFASAPVWVTRGTEAEDGSFTDQSGPRDCNTKDRESRARGGGTKNDKEDAVARIDASVQGRRARKEVRTIREGEEVDAAARIGASVQGRKARNMIGVICEMDAAVRIGALSQGRRARKEMEAMREGDEGDAAIRIGARMQGRRERKEARTIREDGEATLVVSPSPEIASDELPPQPGRGNPALSGIQDDLRALSGSRSAACDQDDLSLSGSLGSCYLLTTEDFSSVYEDPFEGSFCPNQGCRHSILHCESRMKYAFKSRRFLEKHLLNKSNATCLLVARTLGFEDNEQIRRHHTRQGRRKRKNIRVLGHPPH